LNTLSDYGIVGLALFFGPYFTVGILTLFARKPDDPNPRSHWLDAPQTKVAIGIGLLAFTLQLTVDFHFKIPALALTAATLAGLALARPVHTAPTNDPFSRSRAARGLLFVTALAWPIAVVAFFIPKLRAEAIRVQARAAIDRMAGRPSEDPTVRRTLPDLIPALRRATELDSANGQAWADLSYATALSIYLDAARSVELGRTAEAAADQAVACASVCSEFWVRRGVARDAQGRWAEAGTDFSRAVALAPADATTWYYYADHLSRRSLGEEAAEGALAFCLRLDPSNSAGVALRQRLAIKAKAR
jgi:tetratricopeptide (TPR) repeat protein